jgi:hypothetical protein
MLCTDTNTHVNKLFLKLFVSLDMEFLVLDNDYSKYHLQKIVRIYRPNSFFFILSK